MKAFTTLISFAVDLPIPNIDTDMIIPKQYLKTIHKKGLGKYLFANLRYGENQQLKKEFVLNQIDPAHTQILISEENFGCGSSREHAVWSLMDFGIRVIIAPSFADIFYSNCFKNGLLPIVLQREEIEQLKKYHHQPFEINLINCTLQVNQHHLEFKMEPSRRQTLLEGLDEIGKTLMHQEAIKAFEAKHKSDQPWLFAGV